VYYDTNSKGLTIQGGYVKYSTITKPKRAKFYVQINSINIVKKLLKLVVKRLLMKKERGYICQLEREKLVSIWLKEEKEKHQTFLDFSVPVEQRKIIEINKFPVDLLDSLLDTYRYFIKT